MVRITKAAFSTVLQLQTEPYGSLQGWLCVSEANSVAHCCITGCIGTATAIDLYSPRDVQADYGQQPVAHVCSRCLQLQLSEHRY